MKRICGYTFAAIAAALSLSGLAACGNKPPYAVNGVDLKDYTLVYAEGDGVAREIAVYVGDTIYEKYRVNLEIATDDTADTGNEIIIGNTNRNGVSGVAGKYTVAYSGDSVLLAADDASGLIAAANRFVDDLGAGKIDYRKPVSDTYSDLAVKAMSFNLLTSENSRWDRLSEVILRNDPDVFGTQEASEPWQAKLRGELAGYTCVGDGRDGGQKGEAGLICFKTDKFELVQTETFWYSDTPNKPSKFAECTYTRICTIAHLKRIADGKELVFANSHLDLNQTARMKQIDMLIERLNAYGDMSIPTYVTGDFNVGYNNTIVNGAWGSEPVNEYDADDALDDAMFVNSRLFAPISDDHHTYPSNYFSTDANKVKQILDFCFVRGSVILQSYKVDARPPESAAAIADRGDDASDHYPIVVDTIMF